MDGTAPHTSADPLLAARAEFPILERATYLVSHSLGAMPRAARQRLDEYATAWETRGVHAWEAGWWEMPVTVGERVGRLFGAPAGRVSMHLNVTLAQAIVLSAIDWSGRRNRLVCSELDFPSMLYLYEGYRALGAEIVHVPSEDGVTIDPERLAGAVDDRTAVVAFSQVAFKSAALVDPAPVVERARRAGAITVLDAYQAVGTVPIEVEALGVDVLAGGSVKWLCGGPGAAFLYVREEAAARLSPKITGWMAHPQPFAFAPPPMTPVDGPFRYLNGTPAIPSLYAALAGYEQIEALGVKQIRERSLRLTRRILEHAGERGWRVHTPLEDARRGGSVTIGVAEPERVATELGRRGVIVDWRPDVGIRMGPHFYNTEDEVDLALREIEQILARR
jgi:kynureninase